MLVLTDSFDITYLNHIGLDEEEIKKSFIQTKITATPITMDKLLTMINEEYKKSDVVAYCKLKNSKDFIKILNEKLDCAIEIFTDNGLCESVAGGDEGEHYVLFYFSSYKEETICTITDIKIEKFDKNGICIDFED